MALAFKPAQELGATGTLRSVSRDYEGLNFNAAVPLLGVLLGGLIAAVSSFFAGYVVDQRRHRLDMLKLRLQKLEEVVSGLREIFDGCVGMTATTLMLARWNKPLPTRTPEFKNALDKVSTLIPIYFPELGSIHRTFVQCKGELASAVTELVSIYGGTDPGFEGLTEEQKTKAAEYVVGKASAMIDILKSFDVEVEKIAARLTA